MKPIEPILVKLFCGVLFSDSQLLDKADSLLAGQFGEIDFQSKQFSFDISEYYRSEMGWPIFRLFWSYKKVIKPNEIASVCADK